jgi:regulator of sirC expression with transglutaminase-like and TPR domain
MLPRPSFTLFAHLITLPEAELDLAQAALLIAEGAYPGLDERRYIEVLDDLGRAARRRIDAAGPTSTEDRVRVLVEWLYGTQGFRGNKEDYYDPRNSFLNEVLDRRKGIPISLALVLLEVARRAGVEAFGVSFPGHFLVRAQGAGEPIIVDPFDGRVLTQPELGALHARVTGGSGEISPRMLEPCGKRQILFRLLNNLRNIYMSRGERERLRDALEHMVALAPTSELRSELEGLGGGATMTFRAGGHSLN